MNHKTDIKSLTLPELEAELAALALPKYRAAQIYRWLQVQGVADFEEMTNLSAQLRSQLAKHYTIPGVRIEKARLRA